MNEASNGMPLLQAKAAFGEAKSAPSALERRELEMAETPRNNNSGSGAGEVWEGERHGGVCLAPVDDGGRPGDEDKENGVAGYVGGVSLDQFS